MSEGKPRDEVEDDHYGEEDELSIKEFYVYEDEDGNKHISTASDDENQRIDEMITDLHPHESLDHLANDEDAGPII